MSRRPTSPHVRWVCPVQEQWVATVRAWGTPPVLPLSGDRSILLTFYWNIHVLRCGRKHGNLRRALVCPAEGPSCCEAKAPNRVTLLEIKLLCCYHFNAQQQVLPFLPFFFNTVCVWKHFWRLHHGSIFWLTKNRNLLILEPQPYLWERFHFAFCWVFKLPAGV